MRTTATFLIIFLFFSCRQGPDIKLAGIKYVNDSLIARNMELTNALWSNYILGFDQINPALRLIKEDFDTIGLDSAFTEPYTLVFYYSNYACSPCLDRELKLLRLESDSIPGSRMCIIGATSSMRSIAAVIRNYNFHCRVFQLEGMNGIINNKPFLKESMFLLIDNKGQIQSLLVPPKNDDQTISLFFSFLNAHFLNI
jgi:hypothetical protein